MTREQYLTIHVNDLRALAKARGVKKTASMKKSELIDAMIALDADSNLKGASADAGEDIQDASGAAEGMKSETRSEPGGERQSTPEAKEDRQDAAEIAPGGERQSAPEAKEDRQDAPGAKEDRQDAPGAKSSGTKGQRRGKEKRNVKPGPGRAGTARSAARGTADERKAKPDSLAERGADAADAASRAGRTDAADQAPASYGAVRADADAADGAALGGESGRVPSAPLAPEEAGRAERTGPDADAGTWPDPEQAVQKELSEKEKLIESGKAVRGILEVMQDGFGFLRSDNFLPGEDDIYVSPSQIRRFNLKTGDMITGNRRDRAQGEKYGALLYVSKVNDRPADEARRRSVFENMTPVFPDERIRLERPDGSRATRIVDLISPIGKGQRGMIVSPPKAGKTTLLKDVAKSILLGNPDANLIILLIDERPEEVTDMKESVHGKNVEIIYSTFDELPEHHRRVSEMVIERAKRLVEHHEDVIILLDSITRLTRAYNILVPQSGRTLSGGLDPTALYMPKRFFGAARNMREGGSLTILATALVDTGSKMDDVVYEEFKGTGNMELILDRKLQERRIFPAIDIVKSGTRRDDLLLTPKEKKALDIMHRRMNGVKAEEAVEQILNAFAYYPTNEQVVNVILQKWQG